MTDTHTHLYMADAFPDGGDAAVQRALDAGISHMVLPNVNLDSVAPLLALHYRHPECTSVAAGLHPSDVDGDWQAQIREIFARFEEAGSVAVGEVGVDLYHDSTFRTQQMDAFGHQLDLAYTLRLPVIIHCRQALDETLHVLSLMGERKVPLLFHSFTGTPHEARRIIEETGEMGYGKVLFGINGVVTFKNAPALREALGVTGISRIVLETDSPYLSPVPHRGKTNESARIVEICNAVASTLGMNPREASRITDCNAKEFFKLT